MKYVFKIPKGKVFGSSVYIKDISPRGRRWSLFKCSCGKEFEARTSHIILGTTLGCGCKQGSSLKRYRASGKSHPRLTHGYAKGGHSSEYNIWNAMKTRCLNKNSKSYKNYGGRGIKVFPKWLTFEGFIADMGNRPSKEYSIERVDNDGDYKPSNCRWATRIEQQRNKRTNVILTFRGITKPLWKWSEEIGVKGSVIRKRLKRGWSIEKTLTFNSGQEVLQ